MLEDYREMCNDAELQGKFEAYKKYTIAKQARISAEHNLAQSREDEANLRHWVDELQKLKPAVGEENELNQRRNEIMNCEN